MSGGWRRFGASSKQTGSNGPFIGGASNRTADVQSQRDSTSLFGPALSVCVDSEDRHTTLSELTQLALTLAAYRAEHEAYPKQLADLVPAHVSELPKDMFSEDPPHYRRRGENFVLYSVGPNSVDDDAREWEATSDDVVVRTSPRKPSS